MNFFEYAWLVLSGPRDMYKFYGRAMIIPFITGFFWLLETYSIVLVAFALGALALGLNLYQFLTQTVVPNGDFKHLDEQTRAAINTIAARENVTIAKMLLVTNYSTPAAIGARLKRNARFYLSHHWFENEETRKNLQPALEIAFARIIRYQSLKIIGLTSFTDILSLLIVIALKPIAVARIPYGIWTLLPIAILIDRSFDYFMAYYLRSQAYERDAIAARHTSPEAVKQALRFFDPQNAYDISVSHLPYWKFTTPTYASRIARLEAMECKSS